MDFPNYEFQHAVSCFDSIPNNKPRTSKSKPKGAPGFMVKLKAEIDESSAFVSPPSAKTNRDHFNTVMHN
jgi:hypothetical protein